MNRPSCVNREMLIARLLSVILVTGLALLLAPLTVQAQQGESRLLDDVRPSVVVITAYDVSGAMLRKGSGFVAGKEGHLITNRHVIENANVVEAALEDGSIYYARALLGTSEIWDLAVLSMATDTFPSLAIATDSAARTGTPVHVVGASVNLRTQLFSGIVSGTRAHGDDGELLEISNKLYAITSGSPLVNNDGDVIGVSIFGGGFAQNQNFAVPAAKLLEVIAGVAGKSPDRVLGALSEDTRRIIDESVVLRREILESCAANDIVNADRLIKEAIIVGAPIYNTGNHMGCFKVYEGTAYKLLYLLGDRCEAASDILGSAIVRSTRENTATRRAWAMRFAFDSILGVPTGDAGRDEGDGEGL